jgi:hypothetical protein
MRSFLIPLSALLLCSCQGYAAENSQTPTKAKNATSGQMNAQQKEPSGFVLIEEDVSVDMNDLPRIFMSDAKYNFAKKNFGEASADLKAAARVYQAQMKGALGSAGKEHLKGAISLLNTTAENVGAGKLNSEKTLQNDLAQALTMKASADREKAVARWSKNEYKGVGYDLRLAADEIEQAADWSEKKLDKASLATVADIRRISGRLIEGSKWTSDEVRTTLNDFGVAVRQVRNEIDSDKGTSSGTTHASPDSEK